MNGGNQRIKERSLLIGYVFGQFEELTGERGTKLRHAAGIEVHFAPPLSVAEVFCIVAQIFLPVSAKAASPAGNKGINADTFVEQMTIGFVEDLVDNTCKLVAEDDVRRVVDMTAESLLQGFSPWK
jgi:hypothetical protein